MSLSINSHISRITVLSLIWTSLVVVKTDDSSPPSSDLISSLPNSDQSLESIIREKKILVDKTKYLEKLFNDRYYYKRCLLTRPDGFGKTIFLQMVKKFFLGEKEFFKGTSLYERGNRERPKFKNKKEIKWLKYPVIYLDFAENIQNFDSIKEFENNMANAVKTVRKSHGLDCKDSNPWPKSLEVLIQDLKTKYKLEVVVLVDNYDAPWQYVSNVKRDEKFVLQISESLINFFDKLKHRFEHGELFRFVLVTGVLKLNLDGWTGVETFVELTYEEDFGAAFGFTQEEMIENLRPHLEKLSDSRNESTQDLLKQLYKWYGNYRFSRENQSNKVIHSVSAIKCLKEGKFNADHMYAKRDVRYVIQSFYENQYTLNGLEGSQISCNEYFSRQGVHLGKRFNFLFGMLLEGYLTIESIDKENDLVTLSFPNIAAKEALKSKLEAYVPSENAFIENLPELTESLRTYLQTQDVPSMVQLVVNYGFFRFSHSFDPEAYKADVISRILRLFRTSKVACQLDNSSLQKETELGEYADVQTSGLPKNYILRFIWVNDTLHAFGQLTSKFKTDEKFNDMHLIGLSFPDISEGKTRELVLEDCISVPYENGEIQYDKLKASTLDLESEARKYFSVS